MASYRGHLMFASVLGASYGALGVWQWRLDWGPSFLAAGLCTLGGLLPDIDSDSGVPVRELFGAASTVVPILLYHRLGHFGFSVEQMLVILGGVYLFIRYVLSRIFKRFTVHRGMFHSIPGLLIAVLGAYLLYHNDDLILRSYVAGAVGVGFLSHLVLDEIYSVDFNGLRIHLNKYAGSALKFVSPSWTATTATYLMLALLVVAVWMDWQQAQSAGADAPPPADARPSGRK